MMTYHIEVQEVEPKQTAAVRLETSLSNIGMAIGEGFGTLMGAMGAAGVQPVGAPLVVYHTVIDDQTDGEVEMCVPVATEVTSTSGVYTRTLEGGTVATTIHHGPYQEIRAAYGAIVPWISERGHQSVGPPREIYLNDPQEVAPEELLTRVEFPISVHSD
jgi:effector-binding domain-containing protein